MTENTNKKQPSRLSKFNLLLIIVIGIAVVDLHVRIEYLIEAVKSVSGSNHSVDFATENAQQISNGFMLARASQEKHLTGIKFSGRIINTQSVDHQNVNFNLSVDGKDKEFNINKISAGNSTGFNVYIPDLKAENARYAEIQYVRSVVGYKYK